MAEPKTKDVLLDPIIKNNPIALQILGICSALDKGNHVGQFLQSKCRVGFNQIKLIP